MNRKQNTNDEIVAFNRATYLTEPFIGQKIHVYNGLRFYSIVVSSEMLGHRLGEFSPTRKKPVAKKDKKKVVKKK
jgi:small subunit ribosomal protein S19